MEALVKRIVVNSEQAKQELLQASRLIHDSRDLDMNVPMVNTFAHLYMCPDLIVVEPGE